MSSNKRSTQFGGFVPRTKPADNKTGTMIRYNLSTTVDSPIHHEPEEQAHSSEIDFSLPSESNRGPIRVLLQNEKHAITGIPRKSYKDLINLDQAGAAVIAYDEKDASDFVAIKTFKSSRRNIDPEIASFKSDNLVCIKDIYFVEDNFTILYEIMDVSLRQIAGIYPPSSWETFQIATVCKEVLNGLFEIHEKLRISHGNLNCGTVMLDMRGMVKIANIGEAYVQKSPADEEHRRKDIRNLGRIMMELLDPRTFLLESESLTLTETGVLKPESGAQDFLNAIQYKAWNQLPKHPFLSHATSGKDLVPQVFVALRTAMTSWNDIYLGTKEVRLQNSFI